MDNFDVKTTKQYVQLPLHEELRVMSNEQINNLLKHLADEMNHSLNNELFNGASNVPDNSTRAGAELLQILSATKLRRMIKKMPTIRGMEIIEMPIPTKVVQAVRHKRKSSRRWQKKYLKRFGMKTIVDKYNPDDIITDGWGTTIYAYPAMCRRLKAEANKKPVNTKVFGASHFYHELQKDINEFQELIFQNILRNSLWNKESKIFLSINIGDKY